MTMSASLLRLVAVVLVVALSITLAAPARAEADPFLIAGIASAAVVVVILIVYLVVANTRASRTAEETPVLMVCTETDGQLTHCSSAAGPRVAVEGPIPQS